MQEAAGETLRREEQRLCRRLPKGTVESQHWWERRGEEPSLESKVRSQDALPTEGYSWGSHSLGAKLLALRAAGAGKWEG